MAAGNVRHTPRNHRDLLLTGRHRYYFLIHVGYVVHLFHDAVSGGEHSYRKTALFLIQEKYDFAILCDSILCLPDLLMAAESGSVSACDTRGMPRMIIKERRNTDFILIIFLSRYLTCYLNCADFVCPGKRSLIHIINAT